MNGIRYQMIRGGLRYLWIGPEGIARDDRGELTTIRFDACESLLAYPDGRRDLIGSDGSTIQIEPNLYAISDRTMGTIDAAIDPERIVWMPARPEPEVPKNRKRIDAVVYGVAGAGFVVVMIVLQGVDHGWDSVRIWPFLIAAVSLAGTGLWWYRWR